MGTSMSSGAAKKGKTPKKVAVIEKNVTTIEENTAKGARGHTKEVSDKTEIEIFEEEVEVVFSDEEAEDFSDEDYSSDEDSDSESEDEFIVERKAILADCRALKLSATSYLHPEIRLRKSEPSVFGRNFFGRPSAVDMESKEDSEERAQILADAAALKKVATDYMHPEVKMMSSHPCVSGRNYFSRPSAVERESMEDSEERAQILADAAALKKLATDYMHPEVKVTEADPSTFGRNYFSRPSAVESETKEESEERAQILADAAALKKLATDYMHLEVKIVSSDPCTSGRNYFSRVSAVERESKEESDERAQILADAAALKKLATDYMHPEVKVTAVDPLAFGRNYFSRPSAVESESKEESEARAQILADAAALKKLATDYLHPEAKVDAVDPSTFGRNYFSRPSVVESESKEESDERAQILADTAALKKLATDYMHPEAKVTAVDSSTFGRNYFSRPSAVESGSKEESEARAQILADAAALKKLATDYMHPEIEVTASDPCVYGRNFFALASVPDQDVLEPPTSRERAESIFSDPLADMDEMALDDMRSKLNNLDLSVQNFAPKSLVKSVDANEPEQESGKISRSPSSVLLFGLEGC